MDFPITSILIMVVLAGGMFYGQAQYKKKRAEWGKTLTILCGILIIVTALYTNLCRSSYDPDAIEREQVYQDAQAIVLAHNLAQLYEGGTGSCLLIHQPVGNVDGERLQRRIEAFKTGFAGKITDIIAVPIKTLPSGEEDEMMMEEMMMEATAEDFNNIIDAYPQCDVVIIMCSLPYSEDELYKMGIFELVESKNDPTMLVKNPDRKYPLVGIYNGFVGNLLPMFFDGLIGAMTLWKPDPQIDEEAAPDDPKEAFDKRFFILRQDNIEEMEGKYPKLFPTPPKQ